MNNRSNQYSSGHKRNDYGMGQRSMNNSYKSDDKSGLWEGTFDNLETSVKSRKSSVVIQIAKDIGEKLSGVENTQVRKFLDEIVKVHPKQIDINLDQGEEPLELSLKNKLAILRPRFAYTVTKKGGILKGFYLEVLDKWLTRTDSFKNLDLEYLHLFIESLIAYHRVYAKK
jgi:CRISPR type III-A-associated protein Csm2